MNEFFQIRLDWPEEYCAITIFAKSPTAPRHTTVYKRACDVDFLQHYEVTAFRNGLLPDVLPNNNGWLLVSPRCRQAIEGVQANISAHFVSLGDWVCPHCPQNLSQFSLVSNSYVLDCLDLDNPGLKWFDLSRNLARSYGKLVLLADRIPENAAFFGVARLASSHVISSGVRDSLLTTRIAGISFDPCAIVSK